MAGLLLAQATEAPSPADPTALVKAAQSGNAVVFTGALALVAIGLFVLLLRRHLALMEKREAEGATWQGKVDAERAAGLAGKETLRVEKDKEIAGLQAELKASMQERITQADRLRRICAKLVEMEEED